MEYLKQLIYGTLHRIGFRMQYFNFDIGTI